MPYAEIQDGLIHVKTEYIDKDLIKSVPGSRWSKQTKTWTLPIAWASCVTLRGVFKDRLQIGPELNKVGQYFVLRNTRLDSLRNALHLSKVEDVAIQDHELELYNLYPYQRVGVAYLFEGGDVLLGDEMGTGKTVQALCTLRFIHERGGSSPLPVLVVCPNSLKDHWRKQAKVWFPEANSYMVDGTKTKRNKILDSALQDSKALIIINYEAMKGFSSLAPFGSIQLLSCLKCSKYGENISESKCETHKKILNQFKFKVCIADEVHRLKNAKSKQTRAVKSVFHQSNVWFRWGLTGTPVANHPGELWSIMNCLAPYDFPVKSKYISRFTNSIFNEFGGLEISGLKHETKEEFYRLFDPHFRRITKTQVLTFLPEKIRSVRHVDLKPSQQKHYNEMEKYAATVLNSGDVLVSANALTIALRLLQFASADCKIDESDVVDMSEPSSKIDELVEIIDDVGEGSIAVAAEHRKLIELASRRLEKEEIDHVLITGTVPQLKRAENLERFQSGKVRVILFTYKAGGVGLDMSSASTLIRLQRSWSLVDNLQGEDRIHRIGSEKHKSVNIIDIIATNTIETAQYMVLQNKVKQLQEITRDEEGDMILNQSLLSEVKLPS
jgi:SNF2 family DNA or RNA helicase